LGLLFFFALPPQHLSPSPPYYIKMKRFLLYFAGLALLLTQSSCGYNGMVQRDQAVKAQAGNVQSSYQRRNDLIGNLVNTVKGAAKFEQGTLTAVIEARAKATSVQLNPADLTPENIQKFQAAQSQVSAGLGRLLAVSENYPDLKANANFQELQARSRAPKTASTWNATSSTPSRTTTTLSFARFRITSSRACSAFSPSRTSRPTRPRARRPRFSFKWN
jgi:hypothetical protein